MNNKIFKGEPFTLWYLPRELKWYEKILQKLHIKDYYKKIGSVKEINIKENNNE